MVPGSSMSKIAGRYVMGKQGPSRKEGSVLGPLLFLLYVKDLLRHLKCQSFMFADDLKVEGCPTEVSVQHDLDVLYKWSRVWDLPLNAEKCRQLC